MRMKIFAAMALTASAAMAVPAARWLETTHNFGAFDEDMGVVTCEFKAVNDGDEPLVVLNARANCGCTRPSYSAEPVTPGDTLVISVGYNPNGRPGRFTKYIRVETNATPAKAELTITGSVIAATNTVRSRYPIDLGDVKLRDKVVAYGEVKKGETVGAYVEGYNASRDTIRPRVDNLPPHVTARIEPEVVPPGEQFVITTVGRTARTNQWGVVAADFNFYPTASHQQPFPISTVMIIKEDFSGLTDEQRRNAPVVEIVPEKVDMGVINIADSHPKIATFEIVNKGKDPLIVRSVACTDDAVTIEGVKPDAKIKSGKKLKVTVKVNPICLNRQQRTMLNARIIVTTNDPEDPSTVVRLVGEIVK